MAEKKRAYSLGFVLQTASEETLSISHSVVHSKKCSKERIGTLGLKDFKSAFLV